MDIVIAAFKKQTRSTIQSAIALPSILQAKPWSTQVIASSPDGRLISRG
jgi:hypothetical protein